MTSFWKKNTRQPPNNSMNNSAMNFLQVCSDIHLDYEDITSEEFSKIIKPYAKILILAGDIGNPYSKIYEQFIRYCSEQFQCVIYVAGNHEYYNHNKTIAQTNNQIYAIFNQFSNVHFLNNSIFEYDGFVFVGTTLWSHIDDNIGPADLYYMNDFRSINGFSTDVSNYLFKTNVSFIKSALENHHNCIVITHHAPSMKCISKEHEGDDLNCCFATNLEYLFQHSNVKGWIYGHTHHNIMELGKGKFLYGNCYRGPQYVNGPFL